MISLLRFRATVLFVATLLMTGYGSQSSPANRPWPPGVQKVSDDSPPFSPADALKTFFMPPGYHLELVASEPLVQDPVAMDWDTEGRLWVVEMPGFMADITASNEHDPIGRVVVLEDTNGDGTMDKRTVFADGLVLARSLKVLDHGILVSEPPNVWLMHDTNGDLKMDTKDLVTDQFGRRDTDPENNANSFYWALDNRMYTSGQTTTQFRFKDGKFQQEKTLERGEWGVAQDDAGHIFRNTNESALHVDYVSTSYFARNPNLLRTRGSYERLATDTNGLNTVWPVRPNPGTNRAYQTGIDRPDGTLAKFTAVCAPVVYRGDRLPADVYGNAFVAEPSANLVSRIVLSDDGTSLQARKAYEQGEFLASTDERFRPVYLSNAPDGTLYIVDIYRGIIEHRLSLTVYLREHILKRKLDDVTGYGRIYRVVHETTRRDTRRSLSEATSSQLVEMLADSGGWWRDTAQRLLIERADRLHAPGSQDLNETGRSVVARLKAIATDAKDWRTRLRALWTLDGIDAIDPAIVLAALEDQSRDVRVSAIRLSERWLGEANDRVHSAVLKRLEDDDWSVRQQLAASLGAMPSSERDSAMVTLLERHADDPIVLDAALSGLRGSEASVLGRFLAGDARTAQREAAVTMLAATIVRSTDDDAIGRLFEWTGAGGKPQWQRSALLRGAEVALLGATMPGTPAPSAAAAAGTAPCPTCPGGRAGPGGAYAYSKDEDFARAGLRGGRGGRPDLGLSREPQALSDLAASGGELATRATSVLARVTWPGKPGALTVTPLTPEEQRRFEAGRDVYRNICQACHQPDGRGQDRVAPSLVGSQLLFAPAGVPTRILLNGKDGKIGLMPPIGFALDDEQIASVLTYVRREWGQTGAAVDPAAVKEVRAATTGRTRPWTDDELMALAGEKK